MKIRNSKSIVILCPKCGKPGRLVVERRRSLDGKIAAFRVFHGPVYDTRNSCRIGVSHPAFEELLEIYERKKSKIYF